MSSAAKFGHKNLLTAGFAGHGSSCLLRGARAPGAGVRHNLTRKRPIFMGMRWTALSGAVALGLVGCATNNQSAKQTVLGRTKPPVSFSQLDYPKVQLGSGNYTIGSSGCFLTSLAMASCMLHGRTDLDPVTANNRVAARGGFSGSGLRLEKAAPALGLVVKYRSELSDRNRASMNARLNNDLVAKRPVVVGLDLWPGSSSGESDADHFVLIYGRSGDRYVAADPAGGHSIYLRCGDDGLLRCEADSKRVVTEMIFLDKSALFR